MASATSQKVFGETCHLAVCWGNSSMLRSLNMTMFGAALLLLGVVSCGEKPPAPSNTSSGPGLQQQTFLVKGVIQELKPDGKTAVIKHEDIPGYMKAMTMPFEVK